MVVVAVEPVRRQGWGHGRRAATLRVSKPCISSGTTAESQWRGVCAARESHGLAAAAKRVGCCSRPPEVRGRVGGAEGRVADRWSHSSQCRLAVVWQSHNNVKGDGG